MSSTQQSEFNLGLVTVIVSLIYTTARCELSGQCPIKTVHELV